MTLLSLTITVTEEHDLTGLTEALTLQDTSRSDTVSLHPILYELLLRANHPFLWPERILFYTSESREKMLPVCLFEFRVHVSVSECEQFTVGEKVPSCGPTGMWAGVRCLTRPRCDWWADSGLLKQWSWARCTLLCTLLHTHVHTESAHSPDR